jgi:hypothetical protein
MKPITVEIGKWTLVGNLDTPFGNLRYPYSRISVNFQQPFALKNAPSWLIRGAWYQLTRDWVLN